MVVVALRVVVVGGVLGVVVCDVVCDVVGGSSDCAASASSKTDRVVAGGDVVCATATPAIISSAAPAASNMRFMIFSSNLDATMDEALFAQMGWRPKLWQDRNILTPRRAHSFSGCAPRS